MADGDITKDLLSELALQLEDADEVKFTQAAKLQALNRSQVRVAQMLHDAYLTEFQHVDEDVDASSRIIDISQLNEGKGVFRGGEGIVRVRIKIGGDDAKLKWATELDFKEDIKRTQNTLLAGSDTNPLYYVFNGHIYILVSTYDETTANVYYLQMPPNMSESVDPILNPSLHQILLDLAESICWKMDNQHNRSAEARTSAFEEIKVLNGRYTNPEGIGTSSRRR